MPKTLEQRWRYGLAVFALLMVGAVAQPAAAQATTGSVCVLTFNDVKKTGVRDAGDPLLTGVNVSLSVNDGLMIANHLSDDQGQYCFTNLLPGSYRLTFSDPLAQPTTATNLQLTLKAGDELVASFGAVPNVAPSTTVAAPPSQGVVVYLTRTGRLGLAVVGALLVMFVMAGLGLFFYGLGGLFRHR